jgi:nicotinamide-nucleotide amidase
VEPVTLPHVSLLHSGTHEEVLSHSLDRRAQEVLERAISCELSLVTAESCTAGALAQAFATGEGASQWFHGGIVTYTKQMKTRALGVPTSLLIEKTAVSAEVALAMVAGALACSPADIAVSITGVAGPEPDEDGNPVGLIHCAAALRAGGTRHECLQSRAATVEGILEDAMRLALFLVENLCNAHAVRRAQASADTSR